MKKLWHWFGFGLKGELEKSRIALGVAREIADSWKESAKTAERQVVELIAENERLKSEHANLKEEHEQQQRVQSKLATALSGRVPILNKQP